MFKKAARRRSRRGGFHIVRLFISLCMLLILSVGVYSAAKAFSGIDPLKISPKSALRSFGSSDEAMSFLDKLLTFSPKNITSQVKSIELSKTPELPQNHQTEKLSPPPAKPTLDFKFAVVADSHNDNEDLLKALKQSKEAGAAFIIGVGDYTEVGTPDELRNTKLQFDTVSLPYYLIPGDHDEWDSRNKGLDPTFEFKILFGMDYQSFTYHNTEFLLIDNADNYIGVSSFQQDFINKVFANMRLNKPKLALTFVHTPLYHPSSDHFMGKVTPSLVKQASDLTYQLKQNNFSEVFAGDTHFYSRYKEPREDMWMSAVGAITKDRNLEPPRFVMVDVYSDGSYNVSDTEVK